MIVDDSGLLISNSLRWIRGSLVDPAGSWSVLQHRAAQGLSLSQVFKPKRSKESVLLIYIWYLDYLDILISILDISRYLLLFFYLILFCFRKSIYYVRFRWTKPPHLVPCGPRQLVGSIPSTSASLGRSAAGRWIRCSKGVPLSPRQEWTWTEAPDGRGQVWLVWLKGNVETRLTMAFSNTTDFPFAGLEPNPRYGLNG